MEASWGPALGEGGATVQVGQVEPLGSGVSRAAGSEGFLAGRGGGAAPTVGPRIRLWEAGFVSQILPHRKAMEEERVRNFKELQAKFQKLDAIPLLGPTKFPAGVSQKNEKSAQSTQILTNGKPFSSNHKQPSPSCSGGESWTLKPQQMKLPQRGEVPNGWNPPGPLGKSAVCSAENSQKVSLLVDVDQFSSGMTDEKEAMGASSFRDKLWNWEKVSSQKSEMSSFFLVSCGNKAFHLEGQKDTEFTPKEPRRKVKTDGSKTLPSRRHLRAQRKSLTASEDDSFLLQPGRKSQEEPSLERSLGISPCQPVFECELAGQAPEKRPNTRHRQLPKTKPLPSVESLGPPPPKPPKPPAVNLQVFRRQAAAVSEIRSEVAVKEDSLPLESAEFEEPHNYEATISYLRHSGNSINLCTAEEIADVTYEVRLEELQQPWKNVPHEEHSSEYEDKDMKGKEPRELEAQKTKKDQPSSHPFKVDASEETPGKIQMIGIHGDGSGMLAGQQEAATDVNQMKACSGGPKLPGYSLGYGGYVEAVEVAKETPEPGAFLPSPILEDMYDDVECPSRERPKSDFSNSFSSESEENHEEMYEDIYKTKNSYSMMDLDGKEALKRLQRFFQKEKERFKMKKAKPKENISAISISLPDLELRPQEVIIYDDVDVSAKETKDEDKLKTWKPKFFISKEKKKKSAEASESFSPRNFFRIKKQNLEKNRIEREEKLFREKFEYNKEIVVLNKAIVCSNNTRNGIFDLPVTRGEELEVIDITEQNLVICRNSKGKYGYVLIEHLDFNNQGWSP